MASSFSLFYICRHVWTGILLFFFFLSFFLGFFLTLDVSMVFLEDSTFSDWPSDCCVAGRVCSEAGSCWPCVCTSFPPHLAFTPTWKATSPDTWTTPLTWPMSVHLGFCFLWVCVCVCLSVCWGSYRLTPGPHLWPVQHQYTWLLGFDE